MSELILKKYMDQVRDIPGKAGDILLAFGYQSIGFGLRGDRLQVYRACDRLLTYQTTVKLTPATPWQFIIPDTEDRWQRLMDFGFKRCWNQDPIDYDKHYPLYVWSDGSTQIEAILVPGKEPHGLEDPPLDPSLKTPTLNEKVEVYEDLLHRFQMYAEVAMNPEKTRELVGKICAWSYAHRIGNGENSDEEQQEIINHAFWNLK